MGQFSALLLKNWLLYKRAILGNILEILIPILFIVVIAMVRKLDEPTVYSEQSFLNSTELAKTISSSTSDSALLK